MKELLMSTTEHLPGREITAVLGLVRGSSVRTHELAEALAGRVRGALGGEVPEFTRLLAQAREQALDRMGAQARELGADAVVAVRFATAEIAPMAAEILAYGTAVKLG